MKSYTISKWCDIFGITIIDNDGFKQDLDREEVTLEVFINGITECTINIENRIRYKVLDALL